MHNQPEQGNSRKNAERSSASSGGTGSKPPARPAARPASRLKASSSTRLTRASTSSGTPQRSSANRVKSQQRSSTRPSSGSARQTASSSSQASESSKRRTPDTPNKGRQNRTPRTKNRWFRATIMVLATVAGCIFLALFALQSVSDFFGINQPDVPYVINIPEGSSIKDVSEILSANAVVETPFTFRAYYSFKEAEPVINAGEYTFNSNMAYNDIIAMLKTKTITQTTTHLTIPEHLSLEEIANLLQENGVVEDAWSFLEYLNTAEYNYEFLLEIPENDLRFHKYEGYFFPDTYDFFQPELYDSIAKKFFNRFQEVITDDMYTKIAKYGWTLDEAITLASVIQQEAGDMKEMVRVSSVFHNRMKSQNFGRLQSDVTLFYVEEYIKPRMKTPNQEVYDSYNTYAREGLPVGPIGNPGIDAIEAALYPIVTPYYYFVTDINGKFYFAETLAKHNENIAIAKKEKNEEGESGIVHGIQTQETGTN